MGCIEMNKVKTLNDLRKSLGFDRLPKDRDLTEKEIELWEKAYADEQKRLNEFRRLCGLPEVSEEYFGEQTGNSTH